MLQPPTSRAGQRWALGGLQGREGPPKGLDPQEDSWTGGLLHPSSIPPTTGFFGFLWTLHAPGMCRGGQRVPPGGLSPWQPPRNQGISLPIPWAHPHRFPQLPPLCFPLPIPSKHSGWARPGRTAVWHLPLPLAHSGLGAEPLIARRLPRGPCSAGGSHPTAAPSRARRDVETSGERSGTAGRENNRVPGAVSPREGAAEPRGSPWAQTGRTQRCSCAKGPPRCHPQFLAAMTTDKATPPSAMAVAPKSHFQGMDCGAEDT